MSRVFRWARASAVLLWPAYWLSGFVPRDPRTWVFGSQIGRAFSDNAKWLFLACVKDPHVRPVWLTRSSSLAARLRGEGYRAYHVASARGVYAALRAGTYMFDDSAGALNVWFSRGARFVNLWHGIPLKKIEADIPRTSKFYRHFSRWSLQGLLQRIFKPYNTVRVDHIVATSERIGRLLAPAFRVDESAILVTGYPRNDCLFAEPLHAPGAVDPLLGPGGRRHGRVVGYFPTFRESAATIPVQWDWRALDDALHAHDALLVVKLHPQDKQKIEAPGLENIRILPQDLDPYLILSRLDALITDYSSIFFDYVLLDRPLLFFPYDLEHYERDERGFYFEYQEVTPGPKAMTFEDLVARVRELLGGYERESAAWRAERARVAQAFHAYRDGMSSRRLIDELLRAAPTAERAREPRARVSS